MDMFMQLFLNVFSLIGKFIYIYKNKYIHIFMQLFLNFFSLIGELNYICIYIYINKYICILYAALPKLLLAHR